MNEVGGIDLGSTDNKFTWCNRRKGQANIRERLDKVVVNPGSLTTFAHTGVTHLT